METVYKSAGKGKYLVTLEVELNDKNTNVSRPDICDPLTAKYRCRRAFVKSIEHKETGNQVTSVESNHSKKFIYTVGKWVEEPNYTSDPSIICGEGGNLYIECQYKEDKKNGTYRKWMSSGILGMECEYGARVLEGMGKTWYHYGLLRQEYMYKDGKKDGVYRGWFENGQLREESMYV